MYVHRYILSYLFKTKNKSKAKKKKKYVLRNMYIEVTPAWKCFSEQSGSVHTSKCMSEECFRLRYPTGLFFYIFPCRLSCCFYVILIGVASILSYPLKGDLFVIVIVCNCFSFVIVICNCLLHIVLSIER
jgi:hypothetical protein